LIAAKAGVSRGLLHYYFKSKEELLVRVIKENTEIGTAKLAGIFDHLHHTPNSYASGLTSLFRDFITDAEIYYLYMEGFILAKRSGVLKSGIADSYIKWKQVLEIGFKQAQEEHTITSDTPAKVLAALIVALVDGIGLQFLAEPELEKDDLIWESFEKCVADLLGSK
jgi:AcrR family transcriptional regulator